jgi:transposase
VFQVHGIDAEGNVLIRRQLKRRYVLTSICEAVTRANMRFVETKTPEQQSCLMLHRTRHLYASRPRYLAEFGIVAQVGRKGIEQLLDL